MMKNELLSLIDKYKEEMTMQGRILFENPEIGFLEKNTSHIITSFFDMHQIPYEKNISKTGVRVTLGKKPGYHIGVLADMDALTVQGEDGPIAIHSCGHSIQVALLMALVLAFQQSALLEEIPGKITFLFTPAEEYIGLEERKKYVTAGEIRYLSGKQDMISKGFFDEMDCVLSAHINGEGEKGFDVHSTLAGFTRKQVIFYGKAAHAGASPHLGRNALQGAMLSINALSFLKEQFSQEQGIRMNPVITEGGISTNIIPEKVILETDLRANETDTLLLLEQKFDRCVKACADAIGLTCQIHNTIGYMPLKQSAKINQTVYENMKMYCPEKAILKNIVSGASGDIGDVSYLLPTIQFGFSGMKGQIHSKDFQITQEEFVYGDVTKVMAGVIYDLLTNPEKQVKEDSYEEKKAFYLKNWLHEEFY